MPGAGAWNCGWAPAASRRHRDRVECLPAPHHRAANHIRSPLPFSLDRFRTGRLIDEAAAAAVAHWMLLIFSPFLRCGERLENSHYAAGEAQIVRPHDADRGG